MSSDPQVERCLSSIRELSDVWSRELTRLSLEAWDGPTNCPPWTVRELVAHVVSSGEGHAESIRQGLRGSVQESGDRAQRDQRQKALTAASPAEAAKELDAIAREFAAIYDGLDDAALASICYHRRGNRSAKWFVAHRLAEVAFHRWDYQLSLGQEPVMDEQVAALLLPTLLESNAPRTYAAGLTEERGRGERFALAVKDDPAASWLVTVTPDELTAVPSGGPGDLTVTATAATLALLVYGRQSLPSLFESKSVWLDGDLALVGRFGKVFPHP